MSALRNESGQLEPGTVLAGRYEIDRFLAGGGMGVVYVAHDHRLADRRVAIKEIFDRFTNPEERAQAIAYFHREADTLSQLTHPAIPAIFDRFGEGNCHYLVMDFVEGANLEAELAREGGRFPESRVIEIGRELCDVLTYLHSFEPPVIYRDMKPGNVIIRPDRKVTLIDFGIARIFSPQGKATLIGTPGFAPPEQYSGEVDERSDIYGLSATLHYILTGRDPEKHPPFSYPPVLSEAPSASTFLAQAIDAALRYKAEERPASAAAFKEMFLYGRGLDSLVSSGRAHSSTQALEPVTEEEVPAPATAHRQSGKRLFLAFCVVFVVVTGYLTLRRSDNNLIAGDSVSVGERIPWETVVAAVPESLRPGLERFIEELPWEREKRLRVLREEPVEILKMSLENASRDGSPLSEPKQNFLVSEVKYLKWTAKLKNKLYGHEPANHILEGRFYDPEGGLTGKSEGQRFVRADETEFEVTGVTLLEGLKERALGNYQFEIYSGPKKLASETVQITKADSDIGARILNGESHSDRPERNRPKGRLLATASDEKLRRESKERERIALIQERRKAPLSVKTVRFVNTAKNGQRLSKPATSFASSALRFVAWEVDFENKLLTLLSSYHRVEATYYAPNGQPIGTVQEGKEVSAKNRTVTFTGRIGNSSGGAFVPGRYRVDFYVDGYPLSSRHFDVLDDRDLGYVLRSHRGSMLGLVSGREVALEAHFDPQRGGVLRGNLVIHAAGFGAAPLEGSMRGNRLEFKSPVGKGLYSFQGWREGNRLTGTYSVAPYGMSGQWSLLLGTGG